MQTVRQLDALRGAVATWRAAGERVALVPTMGALHDGHMALVEAARRAAQRVVVSIFVNPKQFGANEDLAKYPRKELADSRMLAAAGVELLWLPPVELMYPDGFVTNVAVRGVGEVLDGAHRPGHFDGVATVVTKLLNQVRPDIALFGEKDWQQLAVIRRLVADLDLDVEILGVPTQREDDGLALSSRNAYLIPEERTRAVALPRALGVAERAIARGGDAETALAQAREMLVTAGFEVDYVTLADAETLGDPIEGRPMRLLAAARIGGTRLIDNIPLNTNDYG
ncbi:pantoate--beta-alanine ligase [Sphingomonas psychrotolerans]|uniref:Pantothenate synthetase n=1 Tax=Sphingomonas psychrotolerans TaxID=1327635 RepID=A0A2K8MH54_9SPHN|nr:pantoate--beta-alanine ligase [Sphingomonas psychrotolerans]ATY33215.1 pantoate--beta-alanine ligase [Sphingomonas psychrotolerans]